MLGFSTRRAPFGDAASLFSFFFVVSALGAVTPPVLNLPVPPATVTATGVIPNPNRSTYIAVTLSNVPAGLDIMNGSYNAWCLDSYGLLQTSKFEVYNTYGGIDGDPNPPLPALLLLEPDPQTAWQEVNWLVNFPTGNNNDEPLATPTEVQDAIWSLIDPYFPQGFNDSITLQLISDAKNFGANFIPGTGQFVAIALYADGILPAGTTPNVQDLIIVAPVPTTGGPPDVFEVNYFRGLNEGASLGGNPPTVSGATSPEEYLDIVNPGTAGASGSTQSPVGDLCALIYVVDVNEELQECCGCLVTPDQSIEIGVQTSLIANPYNPRVQHNGVIKIIKSTPSGPPASENDNTVCHPEAPNPTPTLEAWITHVRTIEAAGAPATAVTEVPFSVAGLSPAEQASLTNSCKAIEDQGTGSGICSCNPPAGSIAVPALQN